ncbi:MAG: GH3 auxin-responsive promoter family protein, partial [Desulfocapsaceae bacterium]
TAGGLYRYDINDVSEVVGDYRGTPQIVFKRKGRGMTNLTGEKVSVNQIIDAIEMTATSVEIIVSHFRSEPDLGKSRYVFKIESNAEYPQDKWASFLQSLDHQLGELNIEYKAKRASGRLGNPLLQVMKQGWYDRGKEALVADGKRLFQAKTVLLDSKMGYQCEPEETLFEINQE